MVGKASLDERGERREYQSGIIMTFLMLHPFLNLNPAFNKLNNNSKYEQQDLIISFIKTDRKCTSDTHNGFPEINEEHVMLYIMHSTFSAMSWQWARVGFFIYRDRRYST